MNISGRLGTLIGAVGQPAAGSYKASDGRRRKRVTGGEKRAAKNYPLFSNPNVDSYAQRAGC